MKTDKRGLSSMKINLTWSEWLSIISVVIALLALLINFSKFLTDLSDRKEKRKKEDIEKQKARIVVTYIDNSLIIENKGLVDAYIKSIMIDGKGWVEALVMQCYLLTMVIDARRGSLMGLNILSM
jgi:hypothetical protein